MRRKAVVAGHRPSETLSEGEQKVISLADFLAETGLKQIIAPVIFDDPITSLDYRRMSEVVKRLVELSESRQLIVFTHNIWFTTELLSHFEKRTDQCFYYDVRSDGEYAGLVSKGTHPRADTVGSLRGRINRLIQDARAAGGDTQEALIEKAYDLIRSICEVIVEVELLQGVTQRYQPNVAMTKLPQIKFARLKEAADAINPIFLKCCRIIGSHSQPIETLNVRPTLVELEDDWKALQEIRDAYLKS